VTLDEITRELDAKRWATLKRVALLLLEEQRATKTEPPLAREVRRAIG
jgi:hypothetical protein